MKIDIEINNRTKTPANISLIKKAAARVIEGEGKRLPGSRGVEVSIALVSLAKIHQINKKYRKIDRATDVLSFAEDGNAGKQIGYPRFMGELVICPKQVKDDAKASELAFEEEMAWAVVHGMLHLFGHDHEKNESQARVMRKKEEFYLSKIKFKIT